MQDAISTFLSIASATAPYSLAWVFGVKAYRFVVGALSGKDVTI